MSPFFLRQVEGWNIFLTEEEDQLVTMMMWWHASLRPALVKVCVCVAGPGIPVSRHSPRPPSRDTQPEHREMEWLRKEMEVDLDIMNACLETSSCV